MKKGKSIDFLMDHRFQRWALPLLAIFIIVAVVLIMRFMNRETRTVVGEDVYQFSSTRRLRYGAGTTLLQSKYTIVIDTGEEQTNGDATPLYSESAPSMYLAGDMSWLNPENGVEWQVPAFSRLEMQESGLVTCVMEHRRTVLNGGMLNDSDGTFLFLDYVELHIGGRVIDLPPFSFCSISGKNARVYNYESEELVTANSLSMNVEAYSKLGYRVDLTSGIYTDITGEKRLMSASPKVLLIVE